MLPTQGQQETLLTAANEPLAEDALAAFLGGVGRELFERRYGIDHATLVEGGRMLLQGHGEEAEALFGASLGGTNVRAVLAGLNQEARELFAPQASKPALNALIRRHDELQKKLREASLFASHWQAAERAASKAREDLEQAAVELTGVSRQRARHERLRRTLPNLRRREQLMAELAALADAPRLRADFEMLRQQAVTDRRDAQRGIEREQARLAGAPSASRRPGGLRAASGQSRSARHPAPAPRQPPQGQPGPAPPGDGAGDPAAAS